MRDPFLRSDLCESWTCDTEPGRGASVWESVWGVGERLGQCETLTYIVQKRILGSVICSQTLQLHLAIHKI